MTADTASDTDAETPTEPVHVDGRADLDDVVENQDVVLADFYADWCGPCQMLEPTLEQLAAESAATIAKVDVDANAELAADFGVQGVPTLVLFTDGELVDRMVGLQGKEQLEATIEEYAE